MIAKKNSQVIKLFKVFSLNLWLIPTYLYLTFYSIPYGKKYQNIIALNADSFFKMTGQNKYHIEIIVFSSIIYLIFLLVIFKNTASYVNEKTNIDDSSLNRLVLIKHLYLMLGFVLLITLYIFLKGD